jgi:allophanate hydrolase subunit 2
VFAENQDYGIHGERVRTACWGYLCQSGGMELREVMEKTKCMLAYGGFGF